MSKKKREKAFKKMRREQEAERKELYQLLLHHAGTLALEMNLRLLEEWEGAAETGYSTLLWVDSIILTDVAYSASQESQRIKKRAYTAWWAKAIKAFVRRLTRVIGLLHIKKQ